MRKWYIQRLGYAVKMTGNIPSANIHTQYEPKPLVTITTNAFLLLGREHFYVYVRYAIFTNIISYCIMK